MCAWYTRGCPLTAVCIYHIHNVIVIILYTNRYELGSILTLLIFFFDWFLHVIYIETFDILTISQHCSLYADDALAVIRIGTQVGTRLNVCNVIRVRRIID